MPLAKILGVENGNRDEQIFAGRSRLPWKTQTAGLADCLASLHARCANVLTLRDSTDKGTDALDIWIPATTCLAH